MIPRVLEHCVEVGARAGRLKLKHRVNDIPLDFGAAGLHRDAQLCRGFGHGTRLSGRGKRQ